MEVPVLASVTSSAELSRAALIGEVLDRFGEVRLRAVGSSMLPSIWPGDVLTIHGVLAGEVQVGDVALFTREGRLFAHRVIGHIVGDGRVHLVTQGDTVPASDAPVSASELLGVVVAVSRRGKTSSGFANPGRCSRLVSALARRSSHFNRMAQRLHVWTWATLPMEKAS